MDQQLCRRQELHVVCGPDGGVSGVYGGVCAGKYDKWVGVGCGVGDGGVGWVGGYRVGVVGGAAWVSHGDREVDGVVDFGEEEGGEEETCADTLWAPGGNNDRNTHTCCENRRYKHPRKIHDTSPRHYPLIA